MAVVIGRGYSGGGSARSAADIDRKRREDAATISNVPAPLAEGSVAGTSQRTVSESRKTSPGLALEERTSPRRYLEDWDYTPSANVTRTRSQLESVEAARPAAYQSQYEGRIQAILDNILGRKSFDLGTDKNYQTLYDLAKQRYQANASRSMRDSIAAANTATGGYGSTYSQAVGQQAYDRTMEGLNDQNLALMQMAYQMYQDENADRYNQLSAVQGVDNTAYGRHRDTVGDWQTDRNYARQRLLDEYGIDYGQYMDSLGQANSAEDFQRVQDAAELAQGNWYDQLRYGMQQDEYNRQITEENTAYDRMQDALKYAMQFANAGMQIPKEFTDRLNPDTVAQLQTLAQQKAAATAGGRSGRSGGSGGGSKDRGKTEEASERSFIVNDEDQETYELATIDRMIDAGYSDAEIAKELRKIEKEADKVRSGYIGSVKSR